MKVVMFSSGFNVAWAVKLYDAVEMMNPKGTGGVTSDTSFVYSCMVIANTGGTIRTFLMKISQATGALTQYQELTTPLATDCNVFYPRFSSNTKFILQIAYSTGITEILHINSDDATFGVNTISQKMIFGPSGYTQSNIARMYQKALNSDVFLFYPSLRTSDSLSSMFVTKMNDIVTMSWPTDILCSEIHQINSNTAFYTSYAVSTSQQAKIVTIAGASVSSFNPSAALVEIYLKSPDQIAMIYDSYTSKPLIDLKFSFSATCSVWARPTTAALVNRVGNLTSGSDTSHGLKVNPDNYTVLQTSFDTNHCQGLTFVYSAKWKDGTALPSGNQATDPTQWVWFNPLTREFNFAPNDNSLSNYGIKTYSLTMFATLNTDPTYQQLPAMSSGDFDVDVVNNWPPVIDKYSWGAIADGLTLTTSIFAH